MARSLLIAPLFLLVACASQQSTNHTDAHHPANPDAITVAPARTNADQGAGAAQSPPSHDHAAPATLYACPMHPSVTSHNPEDRCPDCGMKINKPLTQEEP